MRRIVCQECGQETERTSLRQKYCPECRVKVMRRQQAESKRRIRQNRKKKRDDSHTLDSPMMMAVCLNCKRERCTGECKDVLSVGKAVAHGV